MAALLLSVIIPSYNEQPNLKRGVLQEVADYLNRQSYTWEVILSDDGSTDGTVELLTEFATSHPGFKFLANTHAGKGPTVKNGMLAATGEWRLFTDFDQSTPLSEIEKFWPLTKDNQVISGSREAVGAVRDKEPLLRHIMGRGFNFLVQLLAVPGMQDTQCGFKLFSAVAAEKLFRQLYIYGGHQVMKDAFTGAFDVELLFLAHKYKLPIAEVAILWKHFKSDRVSPLKDSYRMLRDILKIRWADLTGKYATS
ncbi:MAG TPA: glycosyl transferase [Candidatus Pacebacteria bacterium]|nr:glycosyl transferase [Candidatus Paceibacterota bacterium]